MKHHLLRNTAIDVLKLVSMTLEEHVLTRSMCLQDSLSQRWPVCTINVGQLNASGLLSKLCGRLYHGVESFLGERAILTTKHTAISVFITQLFARQEIDRVLV